jgi:hypothetical protein
LVPHFEGGRYTEGFENRELRRIFGSQREEDGSRRKLHNDELHKVYSSCNNVRVIKLRRMTLVGHVARMGEGRSVYRVLLGRPECKKPLGRGVGGRITLKWTLGGWGSMGQNGFG